MAIREDIMMDHRENDALNYVVVKVRGRKRDKDDSDISDDKFGTGNRRRRG